MKSLLAFAGHHGPVLLLAGVLIGRRQGVASRGAGSGARWKFRAKVLNPHAAAGSLFPAEQRAVGS